MFAIVVFSAQQKVHVTWLCIMTKFEKHAYLRLMCKMSWVSLAVSLKRAVILSSHFFCTIPVGPDHCVLSCPPPPYRHALQLDYVIYHIHTKVTFILKMGQHVPVKHWYPPMRLHDVRAQKTTNMSIWLLQTSIDKGISWLQPYTHRVPDGGTQLALGYAWPGAEWHSSWWDGPGKNCASYSIPSTLERDRHAGWWTSPCGGSIFYTW